MLTKVQKWGNSQGLRIMKHILDEAHITVGDEVEITVRKGTIVAKAATRIRRKYDLKALVARMPKDDQPHEEWGSPVGKEVW